jgi:hypothetical protein
MTLKLKVINYLRIRKIEKKPKEKNQRPRKSMLNKFYKRPIFKMKVKKIEKQN